MGKGGGGGKGDSEERRGEGCHGRAINAAAEKISSHHGQVVKGDEKWGGRGDTAGRE